MSLKAVVNIVIKSSCPIAYTNFNDLHSSFVILPTALIIVRYASEALIYRILIISRGMWIGKYVLREEKACVWYYYYRPCLA